jgi:hypothetical protein
MKCWFAWDLACMFFPIAFTRRTTHKSGCKRARPGAIWRSFGRGSGGNRGMLRVQKQSNGRRYRLPVICDFLPRRAGTLPPTTPFPALSPIREVQLPALFNKLASRSARTPGRSYGSRRCERQSSRPRFFAFDKSARWPKFLRHKVA